MQTFSSLVKVSPRLPISKDAGSYLTYARMSCKKARSLVDKESALKYGVLPLRVIRSKGSLLNTLVVLTERALDIDSLCVLKYLAQSEIEFEVVDGVVLVEAIYCAYQSDESVEDAKIRAVGRQNTVDWSMVLESILQKAASLVASDVHVCPELDRFQIYFRLDGVLRVQKRLALTRDEGMRLIRASKVVSNVDIQRTSSFIEGGFRINWAGGEIGIRSSFVKSTLGYRAVFRLLPEKSLSSSAIYDSIPGDASLLLKASIASGSGIVVVSGTTGSGKSSFLYSCIKNLNDGQKNIITFEDPVERVLPGVCQIEYSSFKNGMLEDLLSSSLRHDPDIMVVGEIREKSVARVAFDAAQTGHLVFTSVHAASCIGAYHRVRKLLDDEQTLQNSLRSIFRVALAPNNCVLCLSKIKVSAKLARFFGVLEDEFYTSRGCDKCSETGVLGRSLLVEGLPFVKNKQISDSSRASVLSPFSNQIFCLMRQKKLSPENALKLLGVTEDAL